MVKYYDDEAVFDAPVDRIWKLLEAHTPDALPTIHPDFRASRTIRHDEAAGIEEREVEMMAPTGRLERARMRMTVRPPHSMSIDYLSGSLAGTWVTNTYIPEGNRTRVVCTGEFHVEGMDDASALKLGKAITDLRFEEDRVFLSTLP